MKDFETRFNEFRVWLYAKDWDGCPEEEYAHACVVKKFEELKLDEDFDNYGY